MAGSDVPANSQLGSAETARKDLIFGPRGIPFPKEAKNCVSGKPNDPPSAPAKPVVPPPADVNPPEPPLPPSDVVSPNTPNVDDPANEENEKSWTTAEDPHAPQNPADKAEHKPASTLPLFALNHISFLVKDLNKSARFYQKVMGFVVIKRPDVFSFEGSWMFGHGISVHLLGLGKKESDNKCGKVRTIIPIDNHISFQCSNLYSMMRTLETSRIKIEQYETKIGGKTVVDRITFHDPDGNMIEITDAQNLPIVPSASWPPKSMPTPNLEFVSSTRTKIREMGRRPKYNRCKCDSEGKEEEGEEYNTPSQHHLLAMNHVGHIVQSLKKSLKFYREVLEFVNIELPNDENLKQSQRAWLFGHGIGIHLMEAERNDACPEIGRPIDPQDNHISFQCTNMYSIVGRLNEMKIQYVAMDIKEDGAIVNQIFVHDPDGNMIEFCNCQDLPVVPISVCPPKKMPTPNLDFSNKELACKPRWPSSKRNKVEEDEEEYYDFCNKRRKPKGIRYACFRCDEMINGDTVQDQEIKSCTSQE